jgi:tetratricopeptide (TPR) repeat protein
MKKLVSIICIHFLISLSGISQTMLDSLKNELKNTEGEKRLELLLKLCKKVINSDNFEQYQSHLEIAKEAIKLSETLNDKYSLGKAYGYYGTMYLAINYDTAIPHFERSIEILKELGKEDELAHPMRQIGYAYQQIGNYDTALTFYKTSYEHYKRLSNKKKEILLLNDIGVMQVYLGNYPDALDIFNKALAIATNEDDIIELVGPLSNIGMVYFNMGLYDKALEHYIQALDIVEQKKDSSQMKGLHSNIGAVYVTIGKVKEGLQYYFKSLYIAKKDKDYDREAFFSEQIGEIYRLLHDTAEAQNYANQALELSRKTGYKYEIANSINLLGNIAFDREQYSIALDYFFEALSHYNEMNVISFKSRILRNIGNVLFARNQYKEAINYYKQSVQTSITVGEIIETYQVDSLLSRTYEVLGNTDSALYYYKEYARFQDSAVNTEKEKSIANLKIQYETEKKEQQIEALGKDNELKDLKIQQSRIFNWGLGGLVIIVLLIALLFIRQNRLKNIHKTIVLEQKLFRLQMNPHFIFNVHSNILGFIENKNTGSAARYLSTFSKLLRTTLESSRNDSIYLGEEISMIKDYLDLQKLLYENKFEYTVDVDEKLNPEEVTIPPMLIQPFIENAIKHGIGNKDEKGHIFVRFRRDDKKVICEVEDNGVGREKAWESEYTTKKDHKSLAIEIIKDRIQSLNKKLRQKINLTIIDLKTDTNEPLGTRVVLDLPYLVD